MMNQMRYIYTPGTYIYIYSQFNNRVPSPKKPLPRTTTPKSIQCDLPIPKYLGKVRYLIHPTNLDTLPHLTSPIFP